MSRPDEDPRPAIAHVLHCLQYAGAEVLAAELARKLSGSFRFVFLCLDSIGPLGEKLRDEGFGVVDLGRRPGVDWSVAARLRRAASEHNVSLLHAHQYTPFFYSALGRRLGAAPRLVLTEHGRHQPDRRRLKRVAFNRLVLRHSDRVTAVGDFVKDALVRNEGIADRRVQVIHNGIDPARFARDTMAAQRVAVRAELGLDPHQPVLLQVARFHPIKDHDTSICALARVLSHAPQTVLLLAGDGPTRANAEALAAQLGVADQVRFLGVRTDVPSLTAAADLFVLSSLCEGISVTLLEAMAAGLPIVATDAGGNGELVEHGHNGWLARTGSAASLADHLLSLLRDPDLRRRFGERGRRRLLKRFTEKRMHSQYERLYEQMLSAA